MYQKPTVPRSIGGVLDDTLQLYKASLSSCWLPALIVSVVTGALSYLVIAAMPPTTTVVPPAEVLSRYQAIFTRFGILYLVVIVLSLLFYGMLIINIVAVSRGETPTFAASLAAGTRRAPALFVGSLIFGIAIAVGFILLIIPGFYVWNRLQLYMVPLVAEREGPGTSLGISWKLVGGNWWRTASVIFVMVVILVVLQMVLGTVVGLIAALGSGGTGLTTNPTLLVTRLALITTITGVVVRIFTTSLIVSAFVALYQDLLLRSGGGDLEARLGALPKG